MKGKPIADWKGNAIKAGDTIVNVGTKPLFGKTTFGLMFVGKDGEKSFHKLSESEEPPQHIWNVLGEYKVVQRADKLYYVLKTDDITYFLDLSMMLFGGQPDDIICIKGVSDNEQEYYAEYFKTDHK